MVKEKFCFRVQQIIDGLNVMSPIMDYLMKALKKHIPGLDIEKQLIKLSCSTPSPASPTLAPELQPPALPYVDLAAAGVSALTELRTASPRSSTWSTSASSSPTFVPHVHLRQHLLVEPGP